MTQETALQIPSVDNYVKQRIGAWPSLYVAGSYEESKMKVLDQLFNVIGNGIRDDEELLEELAAYPDVDVDISKWYGTTIFNGYENVRSLDVGDDEPFIMADGSSTVTCIEAEQADHPTVKLWVESKRYGFKPYPNFQKQYSTICKCKVFLTLGKEWIEAAIEFYEYSKEWIANNECRYHGAYPCETEELSRRMRDSYKLCMAQYTSNEEISKAYECEYTGDLEDFVLRRWTQQKESVISFIDDTLIRLKEYIHECC